MEEIRRDLREVTEELYGVKVEPEVVVAPGDTGADYATNVAMRLVKILKKNPKEIAAELKRDLGAKYRVEIAGPGFLNFYLKNEYFVGKMVEIADDFTNFCKNISQGEYCDKIVVAEFSDPNPFKVLHVGHLYTSIVGDSISRLLEVAGAGVKRANFGGDVGLHVGKTLWALTNSENGFEVENIIRNLTIEEIARCYVEGTRAYEEDEAAKKEIIQLNKLVYQIAEMGEKESEALGGKEAEIAKLYWRGRELSYDYFKDFYAQIGVKFDKFYPESSVVNKGLEEVRAHIGSTYEESDGAIVYKGEKVGLHTRVFINREGVPTYETKDVGLIFTKWGDYHFDESVVITGSEQSDYMKVVLASVQEYAPELVERTRHLTHGLVKLPGNVKMSSRKGNFLKAVDVLQMVRDELGGEEVDEKIVLAAIKYAFLKYKMGGDIVFSPEESVSTTGNSGVYLLYSTVRAKKILQRIEENLAVENLSKKCVQPVENYEKEQEWTRNLSKKCVQYEEVLKGAIQDKAPYKVCTYLYELAQEFSRFYENVQVVGNERESDLAQVVRGYKNIMEHGLETVLGIAIPEAM